VKEKIVWLKIPRGQGAYNEVEKGLSRIAISSHSRVIPATCSQDSGNEAWR